MMQFCNSLENLDLLELFKLLSNFFNANMNRIMYIQIHKFRDIIRVYILI